VSVEAIEVSNYTSIKQLLGDKQSVIAGFYSDNDFTFAWTLKI
jgi:hypothetical protein